ncbi:Uncharacterised protein [Mycobacterium tuberculosis]|nr:Uncharacterised protein [Mycobacterium tuberculosis]
MRCSSMILSTSAGSNFASTIISPPLITVGVKNAAPACDSGVHIKNRGLAGHSHSASWIEVMVAIDCAVPITPLGLPVVPPV